MTLLRRLIGRGFLIRRISVLGRDFADDEMTNLTERIIRNVDSRKHLIERHPVQIIKQQIYDFFDGEYQATHFEKVENISPIVSVAQNFDSVLIPVDHVSRSKNDNYYINKEFMLRAHTSAHQVDLLKQGYVYTSRTNSSITLHYQYAYCYFNSLIMRTNDFVLDGVLLEESNKLQLHMIITGVKFHDKFLRKHCFLCTGDVYRRDTIDKSHYPIFHQMEGVRLFTQEELERNVL